MQEVVREVPNIQVVEVIFDFLIFRKSWKFQKLLKLRMKLLETSISLKIAFFAVLYFFNLFQNILQDKRSKLFLIFEKLENLKYFEYVSGNFFFQILKRKLNLASSCQSFTFNYVNFSSVNLILPFFTFFLILSKILKFIKFRTSSTRLIIYEYEIYIFNRILPFAAL